MGNVTRDPVASRDRDGQRETPISTRTGKPIVRTTIGVIVKSDELAPKWANAERETTYIQVASRGLLAEHVIEGIRRGDRIIATGQIEEVSWESAAGCRSNVVLLAVDIGLSLRKHELNPPASDDESGADHDG
jgi:single-stranded DNA-binding protein